MFESRVPEAAKVDARVYAVWRYHHQSEDDMAEFKECTAAAMLAIFCDEWRSSQRATANYAQRAQLPPLAQQAIPVWINRR